jgi:hypothetical protein
MNKRILSIVLALILLACFFLPYFSDGSDKVSAFDIVFGKGDMAGVGGAERFLWLLIPFGAILVLFGGKDRFTGGFAYWLPLLGLLYIVLRIFVELTGHSSAGEAAKAIFEIAGYGFWISLVAAVLLPMNKNRV